MIGCQDKAEKLLVLYAEVFKTKYYIVDAFTDLVFRGNPAGICILENRLTNRAIQDIAAENNLSETAFILKEDDGYHLRWFTPQTEIALCGHATLGSAYILMNFYDLSVNSIEFKTKSGILPVKRTDNLYELDFPAGRIEKVTLTKEMSKAAGISVREAYHFNNSRDLLLLAENEGEVQKGVNEDPVTGSSHTGLIPFWSERLKKEKMTARQLSKRGGCLYCENCGERVKIAGKAALYLQGEIFINDKE